MKNKPTNVDSKTAEDLVFEEAFEKPFDFTKGVPNPYVNHAREAREREALKHPQNRLTHAAS